MGINPLEISLYLYQELSAVKKPPAKIKTLTKEEKAELKAEIPIAYDKALLYYEYADYPSSIGTMEWLLVKYAQVTGFTVDLSKPKPGNDLLVRFLEFNSERMHNGKKIDQETLKYLKAYLPLEVNLSGDNESSCLAMIINNLPKEMYYLDVELIAKFICFVMAIMHHETKFDPDAIGPDLKLPGDNAVGLMQVRPSTAKLSREELLDPNTNIKAGIKYLYGQFLDENGQFDFSRRSMVLAGYSSGPGRSNELKNGLYARTARAKYNLYRELYLKDVVNIVLVSGLIRFKQP